MPDASRSDLLARWQRLYGIEPPAKISRDLLVRSIAYRLQEEVHGGLTPATRRRLLRLAADLREKGDAALGSQPRIKPGTRFVREWKGTLHQVTVTPSGFEWQNRPYRSLSEIARTITGTNWNGWTFFGARRGPKPSAVAKGSTVARGGTKSSIDPIELPATEVPRSKPARRRREATPVAETVDTLAVVAPDA